MTKDEKLALDLALEALEKYAQYSDEFAIERGEKAITAIKQARALDKKAENARELGLDYEPVPENFMDALRFDVAMRDAAPVQEPVAWKWHQAPVKTSWGHDMVVADLAIDKDHTVSVYCERDQTVKVVAMFTPPAAQRQWVGLTDEEILAANYPDGEENGPTISAPNFELDCFAKQVEAKLRSKNNG